MTTRVVHVRSKLHTVRIDRSTVHGNPFVVGVHGQRGECIDMFDRWLDTWPPDKLRRHLDLLRGEVLGCHCKPERCHGDVWARRCDEPQRDTP